MHSNSIILSNMLLALDESKETPSDAECVFVPMGICILVFNGVQFRQRVDVEMIRPFIPRLRFFPNFDNDIQYFVTKLFRRWSRGKLKCAVLLKGLINQLIILFAESYDGHIRSLLLIAIMC